jgi:hypothetical protein
MAAWNEKKSDAAKIAATDRDDGGSGAGHWWWHRLRGVAAPTGQVERLSLSSGFPGPEGQRGQP